jgi:hypothetical protein
MAALFGFFCCAIGFESCLLALGCNDRLARRLDRLLLHMAWRAPICAT